MSVNYDWRSVFLFFGTNAYLGLGLLGLGSELGSGLGFGLGLGASESFIAHCRQRIAGDRLPAAGMRYKTFIKIGMIKKCCKESLCIASLKPQVHV